MSKSLLEKINSNPKYAEAAQKSLEKNYPDFKEKELKLQKEMEKKEEEIEKTLTISMERLHKPFDI